ncbi:hypothetical protein [Agrobacterium radiobacter]|nr:MULTISPECIES: hypothetical protein [Agrobacterium tumefaciens complex]NIB11351.1 hypothetical protein [Agrobacterium radiobacter]
MKKSAYSEQREMIVAEAINPIATELRLLYQGPMKLTHGIPFSGKS